MVNITNVFANRKQNFYMESGAKFKKCSLETVSNILLIILVAVVVGSMFYQCVKVCIDFYDQPVTTNIYIDDVNQVKLFPTFQFCFTLYHAMNLSKADFLNLNESHRDYLLSYFDLSSSIRLIRDIMPEEKLAEKFNQTNQTSFQVYIDALFYEWDRIEEEIIQIAGTALNSTNPMEFWNHSKPNNIVAMKFLDPNSNSNVSGTIGLYSSCLIQLQIA